MIHFQCEGQRQRHLKKIHVFSYWLFMKMVFKPVIDAILIATNKRLHFDKGIIKKTVYIASPDWKV